MDEGIKIGTALSILSLAFAIWAWVVAWGVAVIRKEVQEMRTTAASTGQTLTSHVNQTERRLTMLETEFTWIKALVNARLPARKHNSGEDDE